MASHEYESAEITVHWDSDICSHSAHCVRTLPGVFRPGSRPWVDVTAAPPADIAAAIAGCPSGALSYTTPVGPAADASPAADVDVTVRVWADGPYEIAGPVRILDTEGEVIREAAKVSLCRCGLSRSKPFCDGSHKDGRFADPGVFVRPERSAGPDADQ